MTWQNSVCMSVGRVSCPDVNKLVVGVPSKKTSAIDNFYSSTSTTLTKIDPAFFVNYGEEIAGLLFVGLISSTENYFRDILGLTLTLCPIAQAHSADEKVQLGSLLWSEGNLQNRSAFEFFAFSSADNINKAIKNFVNYQIRSNGTLDLMLREYDKLCELRHAVVHSGHIVAGKNAIKLGLSRTKDPLKVRLQYAELQAAGSVCTALVQAANNELFEALVTRWAKDWRALPSWSPSEELALLKRIREAFLSQRDAKNNTIGNERSLKSLLSHVKTAFNI
ncbi:hypothetical protein HZ993_09270 [Rhodoferax sp. AJA081-3]|uniref:hypothetical protein n=1 Tax=Rhodoferax sp. AJA081-3 TaxID=2752316 RepID=UPI001ADFF462|nr:hypothetical protein [Rhodoferax sp. AJA081-3]QTN29970.1 hypothetical protein HZ993_09270 [Rhodoferax sp. AJA081-3]